MKWQRCLRVPIRFCYTARLRQLVLSALLKKCLPLLNLREIVCHRCPRPRKIYKRWLRLQSASLSHLWESDTQHHHQRRILMFLCLTCAWCPVAHSILYRFTKTLRIRETDPSWRTVEMSFHVTPTIQSGESRRPYLRITTFWPLSMIYQVVQAHQFPLLPLEACTSL
jgi:hypothetical protein